ncbi:MAG: hypothetical protein V5A55_05525 [Halovenus sp.]
MPPTPVRTPDGRRVCVVATRPATFERCREGLYPAPQSYDRTTKPFGYMAFYRTAPVSAVTHYARVTDRVEQERGSEGPMTAQDWVDLVEPVSDTSTVVVLELDELVELEPPVENDMQGVRGAWYCTRSALEEATTLSELAASDGG